MLDTCVIAGAHDGDAACKAALEAIKEHRGLPMISAVIYAELARGAKHGGIARLPSGIEVVQIDVDVAEALARHFPSRSIKRFGSASAREYWNFDALIFASAIANGADAIVTLNLGDFEALQRNADHVSEIVVKLMHASDVVVVPPPTPPPPGGQAELFAALTVPTDPTPPPPTIVAPDEVAPPTDGATTVPTPSRG